MKFNYPSYIPIYKVNQKINQLRLKIDKAVTNGIGHLGIQNQHEIALLQCQLDTLLWVKGEAVDDPETFESQLIAYVCNVTGVTYKELTERGRHGQPVRARQLVAFFCRRYTPLTLTQIGRLIGGRDHATALYNYRAVSDRMKVDRVYRDLLNTYDNDIQRIYNKLKGNPVKKHPED